MFYIAIGLIMFFPGYFLLLAVFEKSKILSVLEKFILSFGLGMIITDFIAFIYNKAGISITAFSSVLGALIFCLISYGIYILKFRKNKKLTPNEIEKKESEKEKKLFSFSKKQFILILLLLFLTFFIKTAYLTGTVAPTATDMGHHTYWAKVIADNGKLTDYENMPDFIIGEHIVISEIHLISGESFFSAFPVNFLLFLNILGILTVFILTLRIFENKFVAIFTLLFLGVLFAVTSPQAKFVSGGVVGNIIGNYFMPMIFYFFYRAFEFLKDSDIIKGETKQFQSNQTKKFLALGIFTTFGLFYTHHLTAFIFLFIFLFLVIFFTVINYKDLTYLSKKIWKIIWSPQVISVLALGLFFFFFIFIPNYIKDNAVKIAVGHPSKSTRDGLSFTNLKSSIGEARLALGLLGLMLLALSYKRKNFGYAIISSWAIMLFIMSSQPQLLLINLPSSRIGNYLSYPLSILSAYGLVAIFKPNMFNFKMTNANSHFSNLISKKTLSATFIIILIFVFINGLADSAQAFKKSPDFTPMVQTFSASKYLAQNTQKSDIILKDHNYIASSDTWIKLFFMRGYKYPLSRSYFKRYKNKTKLEKKCNLLMISSPDSSDAKKCFANTQVNVIMVNPLFDSAQFKKLNNFNKIYTTSGIAVFYKNK